MIEFELVTLDGIKFRETVYEVMLPTAEGYIAVFPHHMPLVSIAAPGMVAIRRQENHPDDMREYFATNGGVIEVLDNKVRVLVDEAEHSDAIDAEDAKKALARAQKLRSEARDHLSLENAQSLIDREQARLKVASIRRRGQKHSRLEPQ